VLLTGGTGELGQAVAEHLVTAHGVRRLVLTSRRGAAAPGAEALVARLESAGAKRVRVVACDVTRRDDVAALLASAPGDEPWTAVIHLAGVIHDALARTQTPDSFERALRPKIAGALHLDELTRHLELAAFVLFSSAAATFGGPGQSNYAAANAFLDALAAQRRKQGLAATSLAWGLWEQGGIGMTSHLGKADLERIRGQGVVPMTVDVALALLDRALARPEAQLVPMQLDLAALEGQDTHFLLAHLQTPGAARPGERATSAGPSIQAVRALPPADARRRVTDVIRREVGRALGYSPDQPVPEHRGLFDLGLDSLMSVQLAKQLTRWAQAPVLPITILEHASVAALARHLADDVLRLPDELPADDIEEEDDDVSDEELAQMLEDKLMQL
jgi:NAD(P)-dependent dehydrogenase (short-subunit alcohol dehydrogenase family)